MKRLIALVAALPIFCAGAAWPKDAPKEPAITAAQAAAGAANPASTKNQAIQGAISADAALKMLKAGNDRFTSGKMAKRDLKKQVKATGHDGQYPFASVVACIDSRSGPELVFDQGIGDLFVARVAGNVMNEDILGSLEYAAKVAGSKVVVVLGHTHCGAVKGACDDVKFGNITALVGKIKPVVASVAEKGDRSSKNHAFVDRVAEMNVKEVVNQIKARSAVLKEMTDKGEIKIVGAMLDVETGKVVWQ